MSYKMYLFENRLFKFNQTVSRNVVKDVKLHLRANETSTICFLYFHLNHTVPIKFQLASD